MRFYRMEIMVRQEAGEFQPVRDRPGKCRSGQPGSECCVVVGDGGCEAYTGIGWGAALSSEIHKFAEAEAVISAEGNMCGTVTRGVDAPPESKTAPRPKGTRTEPGRCHAWPLTERFDGPRREGEEP
jgi:hypothetical protein